MAGKQGRSGGKRPGSGRKRGTPNRITADIKSMVIGAVNAKGGQKYFEEQAEKHPVAFLALAGKLMPTTLAGDADNPLIPETINIRFVRPKS